MERMALCLQVPQLLTGSKWIQMERELILGEINVSLKASLFRTWRFLNGEAFYMCKVVVLLFTQNILTKNKIYVNIPLVYTGGI